MGVDIDIQRHGLAHIMAAVVKNMWPEAKFGVGPTIEDGFYYDFDLGEDTISEEDLPKIESEMHKIIKARMPFVRSERSIDDALKWAKEYAQPYKAELLNDIKTKGTTSVDLTNKTAEHIEMVSFYKTGDFIDLCRGPHVDNSSQITAAFKLTRTAGAYWRGNEKNPQMQRVYGVAFEGKDQLKQYIEKLRQAKLYDHRKLGKELDLFCFSDYVGPGLPLYTPRGTCIIDQLQRYVEYVCRQYGFEKVKTPHLAKRILFETSGHAMKFNDELFSVTSPKGHQFSLKPVQCPHQTQIYASRIRSYRDLPIRYMESDKQYRAEKSGEISGLSRVYAITVEDGHSFCRVDQVKQEVINMVNIIRDFYSALGLWGNHWVSLSVRDYAHPEKYIGDSKDWELCEKMLQEISEELNLNAKRCEGEAALYGPKLDFMFKDALGKEIQIPTVQVDFATPKRFNLTYTDKNGKEANPVMVHRAILGSYERFLVLLIEHFGGRLPFWLAPEQVRVLTVNDATGDYVKEITNILDSVVMMKPIPYTMVRYTVDDRNESLGKKIKESSKYKIPIQIIVGPKNKASRTLSIRSNQKDEDINIDSLREYLLKQI